MHRSIPATRQIRIRLDTKFTNRYPGVQKKMKTWKTKKITDNIEQLEYLIDFSRKKLKRAAINVDKSAKKLAAATTKEEKAKDALQTKR